MNIGKSIRVACAKNDMNQQDVANAANVSTVTISHIINGKTQCNQKTLEALSKAFEMPVSVFIALGE